MNEKRNKSMMPEIHVHTCRCHPGPATHSIHINIRSSHNNLRLNAVDHMDAVVEVENDNIRSLRDATATGSDPVSMTEELLIVVD